MKTSLSLAAVLTALLGTVSGDYYKPLTTKQKVERADVIVLGTATASNETEVARRVYQCEIRVDVKEVLWPSSFKDTNGIILSSSFVKFWPRLWWDYTNTAGIFFLKTKEGSGKELWIRLGRNAGDWIESPTNATTVRAYIVSLKK